MEQSHSSSVNRISKSSLQWLLVNKWLPLWMGQGANCKVIDFNFMFSRDCVDCDAASAAAQMANPYGTPRLSGLPQHIVRFNARADMRATPTGTYRRQTALSQNYCTPRPVHNTLNRLRESDAYAVAAAARRYEDALYENVHVHWQNGFEFGRSRDYDHSVLAAGGPYQSPSSSRAPLQRARLVAPSSAPPALAAASLDDLEGAVGGVELMISNENNSGATSSNLLANETAPLADASNPSPSESDNMSVMLNGNSTKANLLNT